MSTIDWLVMGVTLLAIVSYGMWKSRGTKNIQGFLLADKKLPWYHVGLSVMATQASAITFLSAPGQAFSDGMRFLQFYFGLPLAMIVLCVTFIPIFQKLNVYTAYEYLEKRFDIKTRMLTAFLFLIQRGISTGITIYAPSIVLSSILGVNITYTTLFIGSIVIMYTVYGGTKAVSFTQLFQMIIIFGGLFCAAFMVINMLPADIGFVDALHIAGKMEKLNLVDTSFDWNNKYNIWSGIIGGFFLQLSYFGTDQSQVGRYLTGSSITQSRLGLVMNGLVKIPMQFFILLIGTLVFVFYQYHQPPVFFNEVEVNNVKNSVYKDEYNKLEINYQQLHSGKLVHLNDLKKGIDTKDEELINSARTHLQTAERKEKEIKKSVTDLLVKNNSLADINDTNYVFLNFVTKNLPVGMIGLLIAIIFLASMGSTASGLNSLASTTVIDIYKRLINKDASSEFYLSFSRWATVGWGLFCVIIAVYAGKMGNLLEAVNILGSLFYGTILGIFVVAFYMKNVGGKAVFYAALITEVFVFTSWMLELTAFLWLNVIGCLLVMLFSYLLQILVFQVPKIASRN
ncbi:MAG: sodium:solute symporter [Bacteroidetes bacterium]|nr:sodium:solute symporter [Bacteroidota bacterium]MBL0031113.1 sodium:solute symporter [Bacteroidota bacterium]MBP6426653.1 sodium:solute symporter [Bacteroidia bacterium]MBP6531673.1 sodium:solute symporter [Bacteroidia bacterium]MBP6656218.1 sodium:solute symporter [Bacteroidia bacterium]